MFWCRNKARDYPEANNQQTEALISQAVYKDSHVHREQAGVFQPSSFKRVLITRQPAMSTTSQKHRDFVAEPMGDKPVTALSGIGEVLGKKLEEQGFDKAFEVLGQFLLLRKDRELFDEWLKDTSGANACQAASCSQCLTEWCDAFL